jgi:hypothetical protein
VKPQLSPIRRRDRELGRYAGIEDFHLPAFRYLPAVINSRRETIVGCDLVAANSFRLPNYPALRGLAETARPFHSAGRGPLGANVDRI